MDQSSFEQRDIQSTGLVDQIYSEQPDPGKIFSQCTYKEKRRVKRCWKTLAIIKDSLHIDSNLFIKFWAEVIDKANCLCNKLPIKQYGHTSILEKA